MIIDINKLLEWNRLSKETKEDPLFIGEISKEMPKVPVLAFDGDNYAHKLVREGLAICHLIRKEFEKSPELRDSKSHNIIEDAQYFTPEERYFHEKVKWEGAVNHFIEREKDKFNNYHEALSLCFVDKELKHNHQQYKWVKSYLEYLSNIDKCKLTEPSSQKKIFINLSDAECEKLFNAFYKGSKNKPPTISSFISFLRGSLNSDVIRLPAPSCQNMIRMLWYWNHGEGKVKSGLICSNIELCEFEKYVEQAFKISKLTPFKNYTNTSLKERQFAKVIEGIRENRELKNN